MKIGVARHLYRLTCASDINVALLSSFGVNFVHEYSVVNALSRSGFTQMTCEILNIDFGFDSANGRQVKLQPRPKRTANEIH